MKSRTHRNIQQVKINNIISCQTRIRTEASIIPFQENEISETSFIYMIRRRNLHRKLNQKYMKDKNTHTVCVKMREGRVRPVTKGIQGKGEVGIQTETFSSLIPSLFLSLCVSISVDDTEKKKERWEIETLFGQFIWCISLLSRCYYKC